MPVHGSGFMQLTERSLQQPAGKSVPLRTAIPHLLGRQAHCVFQLLHSKLSQVSCAAWANCGPETQTSFLICNSLRATLSSTDENLCERLCFTGTHLKPTKEKPYYHTGNP